MKVIPTNFKIYTPQKFLIISTALLSMCGSLGYTTTVSADTPAAYTQVQSVHSETVVVTKDEFENYFNVNGCASYDKATGIATLTPFQQQVSGNMTLKNKFNMTEDFTLIGKVNLGSNSNGFRIPGKGLNRGGDGVGILFHPGDPNIVGGVGGAVGIGGVPGGFGFKLDTYWNRQTDPKSANGTTIKGKSFGAFVKNNTNNRAITVVESGASGPQIIPEPSNNQFLPITISYAAKTRTMTIQYAGLTWSRDLSDWAVQDVMSFGISGSTGPALNLQQFQFEKMMFTTEYPNISTRPINENTGAIIPSDSIFPIITGKPGTEVDINVNDLPTIEGYNKPKADKNGMIRVTIPNHGAVIDLPYVEKPTLDVPDESDIQAPNTHVDVPVDKDMHSPDNKHVDVPENADTQLPDNKHIDVPGNADTQSQDNKHVDVPENAASQLQDSKHVDVPDNTDMHLPDNKHVDSQHAKSTNDQSVLPSTGYQENSLISILGIVMGLLTCLFIQKNKQH